MHDLSRGIVADAHDKPAGRWRQAMFAADHHEVISQSVVWEGNDVQRMLRRGCRLSLSARQRQGEPARYLAEGMPVIETG
ncbi:hypothetical protein EDC91_10665 [Shewanella fodinae]|uniref:Uncharacterized protein n=1 Tax=Shewanella fodinae TaxID=552357 RepID=A0A4R2FDX9_9GAMM|nr:hypothetical protein EDC91_10665 [Shewanella fodinae]